MELSEYEKKHLESLRPFLSECAVLLKKDGSFPLKAPCTLALYGNGARHTVKGGTGSGDVNSRFFVTAEEGLEKAGFKISSKKWLDAYDLIFNERHDSFLKEIKKRAKKNHRPVIFEKMGCVEKECDYSIPFDSSGHSENADSEACEVYESSAEAAVYVLSRLSGEGNDRSIEKGDLLLTDSEIRDILALDAEYEKFILVLNAGGPVDLSPVVSVKNILILSQLGVETGSVLADLLLGKANPSGHLTTTWDLNTCIPEFGNADDSHYREGIHVGYRRLQSLGKKPLFPFGFGLSWTDFSLSLNSVSLEGENLNVSVLVKNTGNFSGKTLVLLFVSKPDNRLDQNRADLCAFKKTEEIPSGSSVLLTLSVKISDCASFDTMASSWEILEGNYAFFLASDCERKEMCACVKVPKDILVRHVISYPYTPGFSDWVDEREKTDLEKKSDIKTFVLDPSSVKRQFFETDIETCLDDEEWKKVRKNLSEEELALLNTGAFNPKKKWQNIIGNASQSLPGAAGETSSLFSKLGVRPLIMADGPAGLRLCKSICIDPNGKKYSLDSSFSPEDMALLPFAVRFLQKKAKKKLSSFVKASQYTTAIPIAVAIAQSWNLDFAFLCGDIVGEEMEKFSVNLWLAPALNIQRDLRCGRNFEYYSEDPLVSGKMAAAVTKGVQRHSSCGVTLKHFAANNQEFNRYANNSLLSERALREIYLKGFEIAVKEGQPSALMTSYNLINGVHTSQQKELIGDILRNEFGFKGIVMTDWIVSTGKKGKKRPSSHPGPDIAAIVSSGSNLIMPGSQYDVNCILEGLKCGKVSLYELEQNAWQTWKLAKKLGLGL